MSIPPSNPALHSYKCSKHQTLFLTAAGKAVDVEYLKNTLVQLFTTGEAEALLPVLSTLLAFSPDELRRCRWGARACVRVLACARTVGRWA